MLFNEARTRALKDSQEFPGAAVYVVELMPKKRYGVVSEKRYIMRGLDSKVMLIFRNGKAL